MVEDDPTLLEILRDILAAEEYEVVAPSDGREARSLIYTERPNNLGADDYVTKPFPQNLLLSRVRRALLRAHLLRAH